MVLIIMTYVSFGQGVPKKDTQVIWTFLAGAGGGRKPVPKKSGTSSHIKHRLRTTILINKVDCVILILK